MGSEPNYEVFRQAYSALLRQMLPHLSATQAESAVESVNSLVKLVKPVDWPQALAETPIPNQILGITTDGQIVVYDEDGRLPFYHAKPYEEVHDVVARAAKEKPSLGLERTLRELEALRQG